MQSSNHKYIIENNLKKVMVNRLLYPLLTVAISMFTCEILMAQQANSPSENIPTTVNPPVHAGSYPSIYNLSLGEPRNYIRTIIPDQPLTQINTLLKHRQTTEFFDGLGRSLQTVIKSGHADGNDIISHHVYDEVGRESIQYLPYARFAYNSQGNFNHTPKYNIEQFYQASQGQQPYSKTIYENSPLNRTLKHMAPGKSWVGSGRGVETNATVSTDPGYSPSGFNPNHYVVNGAYPRFEFNSATSTVSYKGNYPEGKLFVTSVKDEDGLLTEEVKDIQGRVLMTRTLARNGHPPLFPSNAPVQMFPVNFNYTFYIYDDLDRLRIVMPPGLITPTFGISNTTNNNVTTHTYTYVWSEPTLEMVNNLCYINNYNGRGSIIEKKIPGKEFEYYIYDKRDRLVLYQDGNLRSLGKWQYNFYDGLNRLTISGLINLTGTREIVQAQALDPTNIPGGSWRMVVQNYNPSTIVEIYGIYVIGAEHMIFNYYDNYDLVPAWSDASKIPLPPSGDATVVPSIFSNSTKGMLTSTKFKILDPANPSVTNWITKLYYYDDKGRLIQTVSDNIKGGKDYNSQLYFFQGMQYQSLTHHHNPGAQPIQGATTALNHLKLDKIYRRNLGQGGNEQVWQIQQSINDGTPYNLAYYDYDHLGRTVIKQFPMVNVLQEYNIRGWLKLIHARNPMYQDSTYFRENLYYDDGFESKLYNGNIAGITWNNYGVIPADDTKRNAYGYSYDMLGRLTHAEYRNNHSLPGSWEKDNKDYSVSNINFDDRGNILGMVQMGNDISGPIEMDKLTYQYSPNSNKLLKVSDNGATSTTTPLPDFRDNANLTEEYTYDNNGNLLSDANKGITSIIYNHFNKPQIITVQGKGTITYVYDAMGNCLKKTVFNEQTQTTEVWDYMGSFVYKNNVLQYIMNEEGRSRPEIVQNGPQAGATKFVYDYFIKDHLGNVRTTLAAEPSSHEYYARHEIATANSEQLLFENIAAVRDEKPGSTNSDDLKAARLNAAESDRRIGTAIILRVMPGDKFTFASDVYYEADDETRDYEHTGVEEVVSSLLATLAGGTVAGQPVAETENSELINEMFTKPETITGIEDILNNSITSSSTPRAGLNYLFFDENMNLLSGSGRLSAIPAAQGIFENISQIATTTEPGFVVVYVDNQTIGKDVWFDNVQILHYNTKVLDENHYYPYGLVTSNSALLNTAQPLKYQGKELEKSLGLEMYDFTARMYDPQLGRTWQPDPLADKRSWVSPYSWVQNNPINRIDPSGAVDGPVFGSNGNYRGTTADGLQGMSLIYDGNLNFQDMTEQELLDSRDGAETFDNYQKKMDGPTQAKVMTGITALGEGMAVKNRKFSMKYLDEKIFYGKTLVDKYAAVDQDPPNFVTSYGKENARMITYTGKHPTNYETTFANIIATIIVHEWNGHGMEGYMDSRKTHHRAYWDVINHPIWENTTDQFKAFNLNQYKTYLCNETGQDLDPKTFQLFIQYIHYYKK
jgi:RHS repeat-associated protein